MKPAIYPRGLQSVQITQLNEYSITNQVTKNWSTLKGHSSQEVK